MVVIKYFEKRNQARGDVIIKGFEPSGVEIGDQVFTNSRSLFTTFRYHVCPNLNQPGVASVSNSDSRLIIPLNFPSLSITGRRFNAF
jgi:hypothetical protein